MYNKIFTKILDSSIWLESNPTRIVWFTFLAAMDENGFAQFASSANVAHRARVSQEEADAAIECLASPDANSSDPENEGRRIERVNGGWMILNAGKYRELVTRAVAQQRTRERVAKFRQAKRPVTVRNADVTPANVSVTPSEADTEAESVNTLREPPAPRARNELFDALCSFEGIPLAEANGNGPRIGTALAAIKRISPDVTAAEIQRRGANFKTHFAVSPTASALAKHWSKCHERSTTTHDRIKRASFA